MATTSKQDIAEAVQNKTGMTRGRHLEPLSSCLRPALQQLEQGEEVKVSGFGVLGVRAKHVRLGRNPKTGELFEITARKVVWFRPS